ncbi:MAG: phage tail family protein [Limosilactobacillus sp.]|nr:phage tail family protein [Limosilactobacillus sp.]
MNGVTINGKHSLDDFGLYLQPKSIPVPKPKTNTVSIKGADGEIDLSTALTDGNMRYENRVFDLQFVAIGYGSTLNAKIERFMNNVHGKTVNLIFDDDTSHYYNGRCNVNDREYKNGYVVLTCEINAEPFRYDNQLTTVTRSIVGSASITVSNARQWVVPTITASAEMVLQYQGIMYQGLGGGHVNSNMVWRDGTNVLAFQGTGTVTLEYRQGVL